MCVWARECVRWCSAEAELSLPCSAGLAVFPELVVLLAMATSMALDGSDIGFRVTFVSRKS